jgi:hypothetical protein
VALADIAQNLQSGGKMENAVRGISHPSGDSKIPEDVG